MEYALAAVVVLLAVGVVLHPLVSSAVPRAPADAGSSDHNARVDHQRAAIYQEIAELQFDRGLGKLDDADLRALEDALLARAAALLAQEERVKARLDLAIEREVAIVRARLSNCEPGIERREE